MQIKIISMYKSNSSKVLSGYQNPARHELNLIGLKSRYALIDKPDECKTICNAQSIRYNRTYGRNLFEKINNCRNTFKDFDHIIVPKFMKKQTLQELISKEKDKIGILNKVNSIIVVKTVSMAQILQKNINNGQSIKFDNTNSELIICQNLIEFQRKQKLKESKRNKRQLQSQDYDTIGKKKGKQVTSVDQCISKRKDKDKEDILRSVIDSNNLTRTYFDKNDYIITSKGGVMHTASLWRCKNINQILPKIPKTNYHSVNKNNIKYKLTFNTIKIKPFISTFKVKNLESFIKQR